MTIWTSTLSGLAPRWVLIVVMVFMYVCVCVCVCVGGGCFGRVWAMEHWVGVGEHPLKTVSNNVHEVVKI
jgi:hypothetical protein